MKRYFLTALKIACISGILLLGLQLGKQVASLFYQSRAGQLLDDAVIVQNQANSKRSCDLAIQKKTVDRDRITKAVADLHKAIKMSPLSSQPYLLLGCSYYLLGDGENAVEAFTTYTHLRPNNPLGFLDLGFAYDLACLIPSQNEIMAEHSNIVKKPEGIKCDKPKTFRIITNTWQKAGYSLANYAEYASQSFSEQGYSESYRWYRTGYKLGITKLESLSDVQKFQWLVSAVVTGNSFPATISSDFPLLVLNDYIVIQGETMRWMRSMPQWKVDYGDKVASYPYRGEQIAIMNWGGSIVSFLDVATSGDYVFTIQVQELPPSPIKIGLEDNTIKVCDIVTTKEDRSLEKFVCHVTLEKGYHLIGINFLNNAIENGIDRDAYIDWIDIRKNIK